MVQGTQDVIANGDTRSISLYHAHTKETLTITYKKWGQYDQAALDKLNWHLRDWRRDEPTKMDPRLFDLIWEVYREVGSGEPIKVMSAYRSPETNAMLRRRSRGVAKHSQHTMGKAMDMHFSDVSMARVREIGMRLQRGGVGYYPSAGSPFVHLDVGGVRSWPRMTRDQLARLFPDEKTVHLPAGGGTMAGYEQAKAEIIARGGSVGGFGGDEELETGGGGGRFNFFAALFGGGRGANAAASGSDDAGVRAFANADAGNVERVEQQRPSALASLRNRRGRGGETLAERPVTVASAEAAREPAPEAAKPAEPAKPQANTSIASTPASAAAPAIPAFAARDAQPEPKLVTLPMPPRRPTGLTIVAEAPSSTNPAQNGAAQAPVIANLPLPPARPAALTASLAVPAITQPAPAAPSLDQRPTTASAALQAAVASGPATVPLAPSQTLAYTTAQHPSPPSRPSSLMPARPAAQPPAPMVTTASLASNPTPPSASVSQAVRQINAPLPPAIVTAPVTQKPVRVATAKPQIEPTNLPSPAVAPLAPIVTQASPETAKPLSVSQFTGSALAPMSTAGFGFRN